MDKRFFILRNDQIRRRVAEIVKHISDSPLYEVIIQPHKGKRSKDQNARYWSILKVIADELGMGKDELHHEMKRRFLVPIMIRDDEEFSGLVKLVKESPSYKPMANKVISLLTTTTLTVKQMTEYMNEVEQHALGLGIVLPAWGE